MSTIKLHPFLVNLGACDDSRKWAAAGLPRQRLVGIVVAVVRPSLRHISAGDLHDRTVDLYAVLAMGSGDGDARRGP